MPTDPFYMDSLKVWRGLGDLFQKVPQNQLIPTP